MNRFIALALLMTNNLLALMLFFSPSVVLSATPRATKSELQDLLEARTVNDLETKESAIEAARSMRASCDSELRTHLLPRDCFRELDLVPQRTKSQAENEANRRRLIRICSENAKSSNSRLDLNGSLEEIPDECRRTVLSRREDLRYIDETEHPELSVVRTSGSDLERPD